MPKLRTLPPTLPVEQIAQAISEDGAVIVERVIPANVVDELFDILEPDLNAAEVDTRNLYGRAKRGVRDLFTKSSRFIDVVLLNELMQNVNRLVLQAGGHHHRLSSEGAGEILKGGEDQFLHREINSFPHLHYSPDMPDFICFNLIAGSDFQRANGATRVVPGSHRWPVDRDASSVTCDEIAYAEMAKGSVLFFNGRVFHGLSANHTDEPRRAITLGYYVDWLQPSENFYVIYPLEQIKQWPDEAQRLIGYRGSDRLNWVEGRDNDNVLRPAAKGISSGPGEIAAFSDSPP